MRALYTLKVWQHKFHKVTPLSKFLYHAKGGTPLTMALVAGMLSSTLIPFLRDGGSLITPYDKQNPKPSALNPKP